MIGVIAAQRSFCIHEQMVNDGLLFGFQPVPVGDETIFALQINCLGRTLGVSSCDELEGGF